MTDKKGQLAAMKVVKDDEQLIIISEDGVVVRTPVKGVSKLGRSTQGVRVMNVAAKDKVTAVGIADDSSSRRKKKVIGGSSDADVDIEDEKDSTSTDGGQMKLND